jgi:hypothetical protein
VCFLCRELPPRVCTFGHHQLVHHPRFRNGTEGFPVCSTLLSKYVGCKKRLADHSRTGATGYIGGDALYALFQAHPDWQYTCIVRNADKGAKVAAAYPKVRLVYGNLDSTELLEEEAGKADLIYRKPFPSGLQESHHLADIR